MRDILTWNKKIVTIQEIEARFELYDYLELVDVIKKWESMDVLEPVSNSQTNGKKPSLYNKYRIKRPHVDLGHYKDEIETTFPIQFITTYYLNHLDIYEQDREMISKLIHYVRYEKTKLNTPMSINERSFDIFKEEKYLKDGKGQTVLKRLGLGLDDVNVYLTPEPFVYYSANKNQKQSVLILENKDTWYTLRRLMLEGQTNFLGIEVDSIIYGAGKGIERSLNDYNNTVEKYLQEPRVIYYFGDLDYEGIGIYERLKLLYGDRFNLCLFKEAYELMLFQSKNIVLPLSKEKQNVNIKTLFLEELHLYECQIKLILESGQYIPQEIINYGVLKEVR